MGNIFGSPQAPVAPTPKAPAEMPDPNAPAVLEARRRAQMDIMGRAGRQSTILTAPKDRGNAGPDYKSTTLGAGNG